MHSQRCTGRQDVPVAGSCVSSSDPHCLWHVPHVIPAWQTQSTFELTSTASPAEHVIDSLSGEEQENTLTLQCTKNRNSMIYCFLIQSASTDTELN